MHTFTVAFSSRYQVWFAVRAELHEGEFKTIEAAEAKANELNGLASTRVVVPVDVTWQQIEDTLCSAWEGGSNYWLECHDFRAPTNPEDAAKVEFRYQNALHPGGACFVRLVEERDELEPLTRERLLSGLQVFAQKCPRQFQLMLADEGDADTGDAFLQCCLLGEVVYG